MDALRAWCEEFCHERGHTLAGVLSARYVKPPYDTPFRPVKRALAQALRKVGYRYCDIGLLLGCSERTARDWVKGTRLS